MKRWPLIYALLALGGAALATETDVACREALDPSASELTARVREGFFKTGRDLGDYVELLPPQFVQVLNGLGPEAHWLDAGSGEGLATLAYLEGNQSKLGGYYGFTDSVLVTFSQLNKKPADQRARVTGVTYKYNVESISYLKAEFVRPRFVRSGRGRWLEGRYFEDIPDAEIGAADLITDVFGVAAYAPRLDEVLRKYLRLLRDGGVAYVFLGIQGGDALDDKVFVWRDGKRLSLVEWLQTVPGVEARKLEYFTGWGGSHQARGLELRRVSATPVIPELELIEFQHGAPPYREYREKR